VEKKFIVDAVHAKVGFFFLFFMSYVTSGERDCQREYMERRDNGNIWMKKKKKKKEKNTVNHTMLPWCSPYV
jgi:hypothetical protein